MLIARSVHPLPGEAERKERLLGLVDGFSSRRVLVVGDLIADEFIYGEVSRVSREAPVLILKYDTTEIVAGGAGNAANNVAALGGRARLAGLVGTDDEGPAAAGELPSRRRQGARRARPRATARRSRRASWPAASTRRSSRWCASIATPAGRSTRRSARRFAKKLEPALDGCDAVLLSDYGSGLVTPALADAIRRARRAPHAAPADSRAARLALPPARLSRPDHLHAERVGGRSRRSASGSTTIPRRSSGPAGCCCAAPACRRC